MDGMPKRVCDGPADPFDVEFIDFGLKQLGKLLVEVGRECPPVPALFRRGAGAAQEGSQGVVRLQPSRNSQFLKRTQWGRRRR